MAQELMIMDQGPLFLVFMYLQKDYDTFDRSRLLQNLQGYRAAPKIPGILAELWDIPQVVTRQNGYHGPQFRATHRTENQYPVKEEGVYIPKKENNDKVETTNIENNENENVTNDTNYGFSAAEENDLGKDAMQSEESANNIWKLSIVTNQWDVLEDHILGQTWTEYK